jgi:hypothetical protein
MNNGSDHRVFGFTESGEFRANLYNGAGLPGAGALYSWVVCATFRQLAAKLESWYEQPLTSEESDVLELLEVANEEYEIDCDECAATGIDPGGLSAHEPEECPACHGAKRMSIATVYAPRVAA